MSHITKKKMITSIFLLLLAHATIINCAILDKHIFILAGQSNMAGRGGVDNGTWDGIITRESRPSITIFSLNSDLNWVLGNEPLHKDIDVNNTCGVGPGMAFANSVLTKSLEKGVVGLVPCAIGGTKITLWGRGSGLYEQMVRRAKTAVKEGGVIRGMLWFQGESDTVDKDDAGMYKERLEKLFGDVRDDLGAPNLPIIQVALASGGPYIETVRQAQLGIEMANVKTVDAKGMQLEPDQLHLTTSSQVKLAQMMADAFLQINSSSPKQNRKLLL